MLIEVINNLDKPNNDINLDHKKAKSIAKTHLEDIPAKNKEIKDNTKPKTAKNKKKQAVIV